MKKRSSYFVSFNGNRLGIIPGLPQLIIDPAELAPLPDRAGCAIAHGEVTARLELDFLDAEFSRLLDREGRPVHWDAAMRRASGFLLLARLDRGGLPDGQFFRLTGAQLKPGAGYHRTRQGRKLVLEFRLDPGDGKPYICAL